MSGDVIVTVTLNAALHVAYTLLTPSPGGTIPPRPPLRMGGLPAPHTPPAPPPRSPGPATARAAAA